jgi:hypothetical protein
MPDRKISSVVILKVTSGSRITIPNGIVSDLGIRKGDLVYARFGRVDVPDLPYAGRLVMPGETPGSIDVNIQSGP